jgi:hypothetical protein
MFWRQEPPTEIAWREKQRINRITFFFVGMPVLILVTLFLTFMAYYFLAPWEVAYREHATAVYQMQIKAMPPYNTDELQQVLVRNRDGLSVLAEYSRHELCAPVLDYYRQIAPAHGWTYLRTKRRSSHTPVNNIDTSDTTDYYTGVFEGYRANLEIDCDLSSFGYGLSATGPDLCLGSCPPAPQEALSPRE